MILLTCFGLVMLYSTSAYTALVESHNDMEYFAKQAIIGACSIVGALIISRMGLSLAVLSGWHSLLAVFVLDVSGKIYASWGGGKRCEKMAELRD